MKKWIPWMLAGCAIFLLGGAIYVEISDDVSGQDGCGDWTAYQIRLATDFGENPFTWDKRLGIRIDEFVETCNSIKEKWEDVQAAKENKFVLRLRGNYSPPHVAIRHWLSRADAERITQQYGFPPFELSTGEPIDTGDYVRKLEQAGYAPEKGAYDLSYPDEDLEGFSVPCSYSPGGYIILVKDGKILQVRELRNYAQYRDCREKKTEYSSIGVSYCFLPRDGRKAAPHEHGDISSDRRDWPSDLIRYAYLAKNRNDVHENPETRRRAIFGAIVEEGRNYVPPWKYISLNRQDMEQIIDQYGEQPICLESGVSMKDFSVLEAQLKAAGYSPTLYHGYSDELSFPLKDSRGGCVISLYDARSTRIKKLWNYSQFLRNRENGDYTSSGTLDCLYLPDPRRTTLATEKSQ